MLRVPLACRSAAACAAPFVSAALVASLVACTVRNSKRPADAASASSASDTVTPAPAPTSASAPAPAAPPTPSAASLPVSALPAVLCDVTGPQSPLGVQAQLGAQLALVHAAGRPLADAPLFDTGSAPGPAAEASRAAAGRQAYGVGFTDSDTALAGVPAFTGAGKPFVVIGATDPTLPARCGEGTFLACFGDDAQAIAAAEFGAARFGRRAVVVFDSRRDYPRTLAGFFRSHLGSALGGSAVMEFDLAATAPPAIAPHLAGMAAEVDFVYLAIGPEQYEPCMRAVRTALPSVPVVGGDSLDHDGALRIAGVPVDRVWFTTHAWLGEGAPAEAREFAAEFARTYRMPATAFAALGYDAARLAIDARRRAGSDEPSAIAAALAATVEFRGVTGRLNFAAGPVPRKDVWIVAIERGVRTLAERRPAAVR